MSTDNRERPLIGFRSPIGVWWNADHWPTPAAQEVARDIEALGFGSLFFPEGIGKESLTQAGALLAATDQMVVGTGIASIHARPATTAEAGARTLSALHPQRFVLGLGVSHAPLVESRFGASGRRPLATMTTYLQDMAAVAKFVEEAVGRPTRILAALGPKMIELSGIAADGAMPYLVTPDQTRNTRRVLGQDKWIVTEQAVAIGGSEDDQWARARAHLAFYLGLANYRNSWSRQGFSEADLNQDGGSDQMVRAMVGLGTAKEAAASLTAQLDAGADHVVIQVLGSGRTDDPRPALAELARALGL